MEDGVMAHRAVLMAVRQGLQRDLSFLHQLVLVVRARIADLETVAAAGSGWQARALTWERGFQQDLEALEAWRRELQALRAQVGTVQQQWSEPRQLAVARAHASELQWDYQTRSAACWHFLRTVEHKADQAQAWLRDWRGEVHVVEPAQRRGGIAGPVQPGGGLDWAQAQALDGADLARMFREGEPMQGAPGRRWFAWAQGGGVEIRAHAAEQVAADATHWPAAYGMGALTLVAGSVAAVLAPTLAAVLGAVGVLATVVLASVAYQGSARAVRQLYDAHFYADHAGGALLGSVTLEGWQLGQAPGHAGAPATVVVPAYLADQQRDVSWRLEHARGAATLAPNAKPLGVWEDDTVREAGPGLVVSMSAIVQAAAAVGPAGPGGPTGRGAHAGAQSVLAASAADLPLQGMLGVHGMQGDSGPQ